MSAHRYTFKMRDGSTVTGPVQGCGGLLREPRGLKVLDICLERALAGEPLPVYEPVTGCVLVLPDFSAHSDGEPVDVRLVDVVGVRRAPRTDVQGATGDGGDGGRRR